MSGKLVILAGGISSRMKKPLESKINLDPKLIEEADRKTKSMIGVGENYRPFLDYLLYNARESGYTEILIVACEKDSSIRDYYGLKDNDNYFRGLSISYAIQHIPEGRTKPLGTADALYQGLLSKPNWKGERFTVCNSDNLYSVKALSLMLTHDFRNAMIDYDREALQFPTERIERFAITKKDGDGFLLDIIEKPTPQEIEAARQPGGFLGVSMNIFSLSYDMIFPFLEIVPLHPVRQEKELPEAVKMMIKRYPKSLYCFPLSEHVPDLTYKNDILPVKEFLENNYKNVKL